jgi:hypothetical protein
MSKINSQPKRLQQNQALTVTRKPIVRLGDLICVDVDVRYNNSLERFDAIQKGLPDNFPTVETRSIFMPSLDVKSREFSQPATESYLRELYENGGWIESLADFSDEALALHYNYGAGFVTTSGLAFDAGYSSEFERDCIEALAQLPNLSRETVEIVRKNILFMHKKYKLSATKGEAFQPGRDKGAVSNTTKHIFQLVKDNPKLSVKNLFPKADKTIIGDMTDGTFRNHVTEARKQYPKETKATK